MTRHFTLEEAQALVPKLSTLVGRVKILKERADQKIEIFKRLEKSSKSDPIELVLMRSQIGFLFSQIDDEMNEIFRLGCMPKGADPYLVDFPYVLEGKEVNLCWKLGERRVTHYHGLAEGYATRKPLPIRTRVS